ncbi:MAG: glutamine-hydrolyzing carbamoyl-phosphate synthase small subunit [Spirochaetaceae bacterium]|jgi:carbamoyl-phosphate synthase small subunit|nr:glutamine-hydrolyzing carbamoyl-phosphate synthase small subunit [Spirochaetaceae bacterium]
MNRREAKLLLEEGTEYSGWSCGAACSVAGEVVFTTGMTGYPQALTDPSFKGQILVSTYPLMGNYGVPVPAKTERAAVDQYGIPLYFESDRIQVTGFVVSEICENPSHFAAGSSLASWLHNQGIPLICGIDTRALTIQLRERGVMRGAILVKGTQALSPDEGYLKNPVAVVSPPEPRIYNASGKPHIALIDCGAKSNILRCLLARNVAVTTLPWNYDIRTVDYDGLFLSNGPGDPKSCEKTIASVRSAFDKGKPIFGICLGHQIMALAAGADTYKLLYGHRGQNQPCIEVGTDKCYITSQNHGYAVRAESLPTGWEPWFVNANDGTLEGIRSTQGPFYAVQFHPEGCPGPRDTEFLIDRFIQSIARSQA